MNPRDDRSRFADLSSYKSILGISFRAFNLLALRRHPTDQLIDGLLQSSPNQLVVCKRIRRLAMLESSMSRDMRILYGFKRDSAWDLQWVEEVSERPWNTSESKTFRLPNRSSFVRLASYLFYLPPFLQSFFVRQLLWSRKSLLIVFADVIDSLN